MSSTRDGLPFNFQLRRTRSWLIASGSKASTRPEDLRSKGIHQDAVKSAGIENHLADRNRVTRFELKDEAPDSKGDSTVTNLYFAVSVTYTPFSRQKRALPRSTYLLQQAAVSL